MAVENEKPTFWITVHRIQGIDSIEGPLEGGPDWYYRIEVWDGDAWQDFELETLVEDGDLVGNYTHSFVLQNLMSNSTNFHIILYEKDTFITIPEIADISSNPVYVRPDQLAPAPLGAIYRGWYDLISNSFSGDTLLYEEGLYRTSGDFDGSLTTDENDAELWFSVVDNYEAPIADAGPDQSGQTGDLISFSASNSTASEGSIIVSYEWDWDNDGVFDAFKSDFKHRFELEGEYIVTLKVTDSIGEIDTDTMTVSILNRNPIVSFNWLPVEPTILDKINFNDTSEDVDGNIVSWFWDFGDGMTSSEEDPMHQYQDKGIYTVTLNVLDDDGASGSVSLEVVLGNVGPVARFLFSPDEGTVGVGIRFMDKSLDPENRPLDYYWNFGDDSTSTEKNPLHTYETSGIKIVRLTVTDDEGLSNTTTQEIMVFPNVRPIADFSYSPDEAKIDETFYFVDKSYDEDGFIATWDWDFGDGKSSSRQDTDHHFSESGTYYVTLTVGDNDGNTDSITKPVTVINLPPMADFSISTVKAKVGDEISFTDSSSDPEGKALTYDWDFDDGSSSSQNNPKH
jgi:PKD repeat protein